MTHPADIAADRIYAALPTADPVTGEAWETVTQKRGYEWERDDIFAPRRPTQDWTTWDEDDNETTGRYTDEEHAAHLAAWEVAIAEHRRTNGTYYRAGPMWAEATCPTPRSEWRFVGDGTAWRVASYTVGAG